jgi:UDP-N-acetylmuramoylalanine--D-glutamate ligase
MLNIYGFDSSRPVLVYGLGGSGRAVVEKLSEIGQQVWAWDDGEGNVPEEIMAREGVQRRQPTGAEWPDVQAVIKAPGIGMETPLIAAAQEVGVHVMGEADLLWRREKNSGAVWLGITGTNGKSTTTALIAHVLKEAGKRVAVGGNLGIPALALPEVGEGGFYVLELSSYQLELMQELAVDGAIFLNLTPDHLERHMTMEGYCAAKQRLFDLASPGATKVLGIDQAILQNIAANSGAVTMATQGQPADFSFNNGAVYQGHERMLNLTDFPTLPGPHNAQNIMAAYALLVPRWLTKAEFVAGVKTFKGLPHRLEKVGTLGGVRFINDSKATNGDSAVYALQSYPFIYWICGGKPKTDGLGACVNHLQAVRAAFTIGEAGPAFTAELNARGAPSFTCGTMDKAVAQAYRAARAEGLEGAVVLLSPACASFDQFRNFEHRGDVFANCVRALADEVDA